MNIMNSAVDDMPEIFRLYRLATAFQKERFPENQWPTFEEALIAAEIAEKRQFKLMVGDRVACVWAIAFSDPEIWTEDDGQSAIYIHRIATNPDFRGNNYVKLIVDWAKATYAGTKKYIRLDTCGENHKLIQHYKNCGFDFLGIKRLENALNLPVHYHNADVCYFEITLG